MKTARKILAAVIMAATAASMATAVSAAGESFNGYIAFQDTVYSYRNEWNHSTMGKDSKYFNSVVVWGNNDPEKFPAYEDNFDYDIEGYAIPTTFTDVVIDKDGTYTVSVDNFDWTLDGATSFNTLFLSTDVPLDKGAVFSDAKIIVDGTVTETVDAPMQNPDIKDYVQLLFANVWNTTLDSYDGAYPTKTLAIEFTVSGLSGASAGTDAAETAAEDKGNAETGIEGIGAVAGLGILALSVAGIAAKRIRSK